MAIGTEDGQVCGRIQIRQVWTGGAVKKPSHDEVWVCDGVIELQPDPRLEGCSCHLAPPCSYCVSTELTCPVCGWRQDDAANPAGGEHG